MKASSWLSAGSRLPCVLSGERKSTGLWPFDWVGERASDLDWYVRFLWRRWWRRYRRAPAAEPAGETPAGGQEGSEGIFGRPDLFVRRRSQEASRPADPLREEEIDRDAVEKALARRREEGE